MKSSSGEHFIALDHVRALAALLVFTWHFCHGDGSPVPLAFTPVFPLSIFDEGHTGVALFMTLSGYLFAKLLDGKTIDYKLFVWNRFLRLAPLLILVIAIVGIQQYVNFGQRPLDYARVMARGIVAPVFPNGGWSITVEFHFYLLLPLLLWLLSRSKLSLLAVVAAAILLRLFLYHGRGEIQSLAYWTIVGRIDQFVLGMLAGHFRARLAQRHLVAALTFCGFTFFYWYFDLQGGLALLNPSLKATWIVLPTVEGLAYGTLIAWYDSSFHHSAKGVSRFVGRLGAYSYSIYLLHFFVFFRMSAFIRGSIMDISNFYVACVWALACFLLMIIPGYLSFRFIESPFLKLRRPYLKAHRISASHPENLSSLPATLEPAASSLITPVD